MALSFFLRPFYLFQLSLGGEKQSAKKKKNQILLLLPLPGHT